MKLALHAEKEVITLTTAIKEPASAVGQPHAPPMLSLGIKQRKEEVHSLDGQSNKKPPLHTPQKQKIKLMISTQDFNSPTQTNAQPP